jgi:hypothetical protein
MPSELGIYPCPAYWAIDVLRCNGPGAGVAATPGVEKQPFVLLTIIYPERREA